MEKPVLSFIECAIEVLRVNQNIPMTSKEILIQIFDLRLRLNSSSETPEQTLNATLNRHSINTTAKGNENFSKYIEIVSIDAVPRRYRLTNYNQFEFQEEWLSKMKLAYDSESLNIYVDFGDDKDPIHIVYWHEDEWKEDSSVVASIMSAMDLFYTDKRDLLTRLGYQIK